MLLSLLLVGASFARQATAPAATSPQAAPAYRQANTVAVIALHGPIDAITVPSVERRLAKAVSAGAQAIVIDLDTPGGEVPAALDLCFLIKSRFPANTIAWINPQAYSAGTIIALACREIVVAPNAAFGDAAPIMAPLGVLINMPAAERGKIESVLLSEVVDSARRNHYDEKLVQAFVAVGHELWMLQNVDTGDYLFVDAAEYQLVMGEEPPRAGGSRPSPPAGAGRLLPDFNPQFGSAPRATERPSSAEESAAQQQFDSLRPSARPKLTSDDRGKYKLIMQVDSDQRLLTLQSSEAIFYGLARQTIANDTELAQYFAATSVLRFDETWSEHLARFLMSTPVRGVLIVIFLVCLFVEIATPGVGVFGIAAVVALLLLVGAPAIMGLSQWWTVLAILAGIILVMLEIFVIPGYGVTGVLGVACLLAGFVFTFVSGDLTSAEGQRELWTGIGTTIVSVFAAGIGMWFVSRQLESIPFMKRLVLTAEIATPAGGPDRPVGLLEAMGATGRVLQIGDQGIAATDLRPVGRGMFDGRMVEVHSVGGYVTKGSLIEVVGVDQASITVEERRA